MLVGAGALSYSEFWAILSESAEADPLAKAILLQVRLPRAVMSILVGMGLSISGAMLQSLFRNPLADPGLIGVSSGASVGAVAVIVGFDLAGAAAGFLWLPIGACVGAFSATFIVSILAQERGTMHTGRLLLSGLAIMALGNAVLGLAMHLSTEVQLRSISFWLLGSIAAADWYMVVLVGTIVTISLLFTRRAQAGLDALSLGEVEAKQLGISVAILKRKIVILVTLTVGCIVAFTGMIAFVGLLVPHLSRLLVGPAHRFSLPASALLGGGLMLCADTLARTIVAPAELPVGIITAFIGAPVFIYLMRSRPVGGDF